MLLEDELEEIYQQLTQLLDEDGPLWTIPPELPAYFSDLMIIEIAQRYMDRDKEIKSEGRAVICSAGPPGAGKSTAMNELDSPSTYRKIDPDVSKDLILAEAMRQGILDYRKSYVLADNRYISPRELAWHVHEISTKVTDIVRHLALDAGENVMIDGTLSWEPLGNQYVDEFYAAGYESLTVVNVELPFTEDLNRAKIRWWHDRSNGDPLGGRFVPAAAIRSCYQSDNETDSLCAINALNLAIQAGDELGSGTLIRFGVNRDTGKLQKECEKNFGDAQ